MWCIPPDQDAAFVAAMEQVLQVYAGPHDPRRPVVCMDEQPKQLIRESRPSLTAPDASQRVDHEYVREGVCHVWMFNEPLAPGSGWRDVRVSERRTRIDWAHQIKALVDHPRYAGAERITLVCDQLNTHALGSLYQAFDPAEALRIANRIELVHTPKHGSWLNIAECELSVLTRQCLNRRIGDAAEIDRQACAWAAARNAAHAGVDWRFTTDDARIKLKRLYPKTVG